MSELDTNAIAIIAEQLAEEAKAEADAKGKPKQLSQAMSNTEITIAHLYGPMTKSAADKPATDAGGADKPLTHAKFMSACADVAKEDGMTDSDAITTKCESAWKKYQAGTSDTATTKKE